jgi:hypothetical protein
VNQFYIAPDREDPAAVLALRLDRPDEWPDRRGLPGRGGEGQTGPPAVQPGGTLISTGRLRDGPDPVPPQPGLGARLRLADHRPADRDRRDGIVVVGGDAAPGPRPNFIVGPVTLTGNNAPASSSTGTW